MGKSLAPRQAKPGVPPEYRNPYTAFLNGSQRFTAISHREGIFWAFDIRIRDPDRINILKSKGLIHFLRNVIAFNAVQTNGLLPHFF